TAVFALGVDHTQRVSGLRLVGILLGFVGIVALVGFEPGGGDRAIWGSLAIVGATVCYALGGLYAGRRFVGLRPELVAFGSLCWATIFALPLGSANATAFGWETLAALLFLGVAATAVAYLLYFGLIAGAAPPARSSSPTSSLRSRSSTARPFSTSRSPRSRSSASRSCSRGSRSVPAAPR
ncbi:MAG: DMT family transporter, partial [Actinobacteria bacterium]|nr:DMT family transporter [Actinomycetota bacterium]